MDGEGAQSCYRHQKCFIEKFSVHDIFYRIKQYFTAKNDVRNNKQNVNDSLRYRKIDQVVIQDHACSENDSA